MYRSHHRTLVTRHGPPRRGPVTSYGSLVAQARAWILSGASLFWIFTAGGAVFAAVGLAEWQIGPLLDRRSGRLIFIVAELSAIGGAASGNHPTVVTAVNIVLCAVLAGAVPVAASRCPPWLVALASLPIAACGVLADDPPFFGPAAGIAGAAIAVGITLGGFRAPVLRAVAGAFVAQAALRLPWPDPLGSTALVAGACLTPLLIVGWARARSRERRIATIVTAVVAGAMVIGVASVAYLGITTQRDARDGVKAAQRAVDALSDGDRATATAQLDIATALLSDVDSKTHSWWAAPALIVPVVSQHVELAQQFSDIATDALAAANDANERSDPNKLRLEGSTIDLDLVRSFEEPLESASNALRRLTVAIDDATSGVWIVDPLKDRLGEFDEDISRASRDTSNALETVRKAPGLLGGESPRRYFLALMTPVELRGTLGIVGSYGEVTADNGTISLAKIGRNTDLNEGGLGATNRVLNAPPDFVARYEVFDPQGAWQNTPMSPDWPTNAAVMADLYPQSGGQIVDGVIGLDPLALAAFLKITGPITVPSWPEPISAFNARKILFYDQYQAFGERTERISFLGEVAALLWTKLVETAPDPVELADVLGPVAREGHLMIWSTDPDEEALFRTLGISGQIAPLVGDDVFAVTGINTGGDKMDAYLDRTIDYAVQWNPTDQTVAATATVTMTNVAPAEGLPAYVTDVNSATSVVGENRNWVTVYSPLTLVDATLDGSPVGPDQKTELGRNAISQYVRISPGDTSTFAVRLAGQATGTQYRMNITRQVMARDEKFVVSLTVPDGWKVSSTTKNATVTDGGTTVRVELGPERDHLVVFDADRS